MAYNFAFAAFYWIPIEFILLKIYSKALCFFYIFGHLWRLQVCSIETKSHPRTHKAQYSAKTMRVLINLQPLIPWCCFLHGTVHADWFPWKQQAPANTEVSTKLRTVNVHLPNELVRCLQIKIVYSSLG